MQFTSFLSTFTALALSSTVAHSQSPHAATVLEFGMDDTLFVADSVAGTIHAYDLPNEGAAPAEDTAYNILNLDLAVEAALSADARSVIYHDLAVHPVTRDAYVSVSYRANGAEQSAVVAVTRQGSAQALDLAALPSSTFTLQDAAETTVSFWRDIPAPTLTVTDLDFADGELFVSGLSTGEFASTLRRVPYPFSETSSSTSVEIFHAAHGQMETRAPIRAMTVVDLAGTPTVIAAYTCTPLVTLPAESLVDGAHITGKTIAELGYGNTPLDVLAFSAADMQGQVQSYVLVINREMDADLITMDAVTASANGAGISEPIPYLGATSGVETVPLPLSGVLQVADQDNAFLLALRRNLETGAMELVSFRKGAFFRLSTFISEYNFPDYVYAEDQFAQGARMFQNMLKADEGFPDQFR